MLSTWIGSIEKPVMRLRLSWARRRMLYFDLPPARSSWPTSISATFLAKRVGQRRNEGGLLVAGHHGIDDMAAIGAQHASVVVHRNANDQRGNPVVQARGNTPIGLILPRRAPSADDVVAGGDRFEQPRDLLGRILQVGVEGDDHLAAAFAEPGEQGGMLAEIAGQLDDPDRPCSRRRSPAVSAANCPWSRHPRKSLRSWESAPRPRPAARHNASRLAASL